MEHSAYAPVVTHLKSQRLVLRAGCNLCAPDRKLHSLRCDYNKLHASHSGVESVFRTRSAEFYMFKTSVDMQSIQKQFQDLRALLMTVVGNLTRSGNPVISTAIQDISRVTQSLSILEQSANDYLKERQSQLGALMGVGRAINSTLGLKRVLEEVMDTLIELMRAERGFLMLKESSGDLAVRIARGIAHMNLEEDTLKVSQTVVRKV